MTSKAQTITAKLPGYQRDRHRWRRQILRAVLQAQAEAGVVYAEDARFEVVVLLYMKRWTPSFGQVFVTAKVESWFRHSSYLGLTGDGA